MSALASALVIGAALILLAAAGGTLASKHPQHFTLIITVTLLLGLAAIGALASLTEGIA